MLEIKTLEQLRGNNIVIYSIKTLLEKKSFPKLSIMSGMMGVGKTSVARIVANQLDESDIPVKTYNCGILEDMSKLQEEVFSLSPMKPRAFIFEEIHSLTKSQQDALLQMFDSQSPNIYVICTTTELNKVIRTIKSRARVWEFKLLSERQLRQLLDDYLDEQNYKMSAQAKTAILRASHGVPRDLIKNADFAIAGDFDNLQLDTLLGNVSDELVYSVLSSLKSQTVDFVCNIETFIDDPSYSKLNAINDFWLRYLLERASKSRTTISNDMIKYLDEIFTPTDIAKVTKTLLHAKPETLLLELVNLNMIFQESSNKTVLGQQRAESREAEVETRTMEQSIANSPAKNIGKLSLESVKGFTL